MTSENKRFSENDRIFYSDGYKLAQSALANGLTKAGLFAAIKSLYEAIDALNNSILIFSEKQNIKVACAKGCHWCCHQAVFSNSYELHYLSEIIKQSLDNEALNQLLQKTEAKYKITSGLSNEDVLKFKSPCPLLIDGACSFYAERPMACRIYLSTKLESCIEFYTRPENEENYPALLDFPLRAGQMMNEGFRSALKESGIETAEFKFEEGLRIVLKNDQPDF
jgi:Fe-S-cluster containining protein